MTAQEFKNIRKKYQGKYFARHHVGSHNKEVNEYYRIVRIVQDDPNQIILRVDSEMVRLTPEEYNKRYTFNALSTFFWRLERVSKNKFDNYKNKITRNGH